jgi:TonB family protein
MGLCTVPVVERREISSQAFWIWTLFLAIGLAGFVISNAPAPAAERADETKKAARIAFDIAPQSLEEALDVYSSTSDVQVLYETSLTSGRRSTRVRGLFTPEAALKALLAGTGLTARYMTSDSYTIVPQQATASLDDAERAQLPPSVVRYDHFLGMVQGRILDALCQTTETQPGHYRIKLSFQIAPSGTVSQASLLDSTGDDERDSAIVDAVGRLKVDQPQPAELPQPITMVIAPRPPEVTGDCASVTGQKNK